MRCVIGALRRVSCAYPARILCVSVRILCVSMFMLRLFGPRRSWMLILVACDRVGTRGVFKNTGVFGSSQRFEFLSDPILYWGRGLCDVGTAGGGGMLMCGCCNVHAAKEKVRTNPCVSRRAGHADRG